tara:strand:+ start:91 stop:195 length:105 start_codon:yes stop_codon:yes gene_type:complete
LQIIYGLEKTFKVVLMGEGMEEVVKVVEVVVPLI